MLNLKTIRKIIISCILLLALTLPLSVKAEEELFDVTADATENEYDETYTVNIDVENLGADFGGYVRLQLSGRNYKTMSYETYAAIAAGETEKVTLTIPVSGDYDYSVAYAAVQIVDEKGKVIFEENVRKLFEEKDSYYAVLSDDPTAYSWLASTRDYWYDSYQRILEKSVSDADLKDEKGLDGIKVLFMDGIDSGKFSREQIENIQKWVKNGGILVLGTGSNLDDSFWAFDPDFIDAELSTGNCVQQYINYGYSDMDVCVIDYGSSYDSGSYYVSDGALKRAGAGAVVLLEFSYGVQNFDTYSFSADLGSLFRFYDLIDNSHYTTYKVYNNDIENVFNLLQGDSSFSVDLLRFVVVIYILLIGPGLYFILKKLNKREKIWIFIPVTSLAFVLIVFLLSAGSGPAKQYYSTVRVAEADGEGYEADFVMGYHAKTDEWSVNIPKNAIGAAPMMATYDYDDSGAYDYLSSMRPGGMRLFYKPNGVFDTAYFKVNRKNKGYGPLKFSLTSSGGRISGTIQNKTGHDFMYYLVICDGNYVICDGGKNGSKIDIDTRATAVNAGSILSQATSAYDARDFESARYLAVMSLSVLQLHEGENAVVGVCSADRLLEGNQNEDAFLCIYEKE